MPKTGEGSKGGTVIGHTKSGKAIYKHGRHAKHTSFNTQDHRDAANLHYDVTERAHKRLSERKEEDPKFKPKNQKGSREFIMHHHKMMVYHQRKANNSMERSEERRANAESKQQDIEQRANLDSSWHDTLKTAYAAYDDRKKVTKGGMGSGRKGHKTEGLSEAQLHDRREKFAGSQYAKFRHHSGEGLNDADKFKHGMVQDAKNSGYIKKAELLELLNKAKYIKREGGPGNYKYTYAEPKNKSANVDLLKEAYGKQITFSGPGGKEYSAHVYSEPDDEGKIILKFPSHGYRRVEIASIQNPVVEEMGALVAPKPIVKGKSDGWPPSGFKEPERKGNKTTEKLWYKLGTENQEGRPDTTGKLSIPKNKYMSPVGSTCNLVGNVAFGKASDHAQRQLNQKLQMTEVLLTDMGIKMKTPMDFICQDMEDGQRGVMAQFLPMNQHRNDKINLAKNLKTVNKSLLHEIGHGIDYAMEQKGLAGSYFRGNPSHLKEEIEELTTVLRNSKFYEATGAKDAPGNKDDTFLEPDERFASYLKDQSEVFARAFEVYTLNHAQEMVSEGKLPKEYIENFVPDYLKAGFTQRTIDPEAYDETMDKVTEIMDRIFSNRAIQKAMQAVDLLEALRKNELSIDDQGSAIETGNYSNDLRGTEGDPRMDQISDALDGHMFGMDPVEVTIAPGTTLTAVKTDDGVYSGHVKRVKDGEVENVLKIEKQTLPTILQYLKAKELIEPEVSKPDDDSTQTVEAVYKMKLIDLLNKLL